MAVQLPKTIRQWFTPEQACVYLSQAFECEIELSDLSYFLINRQIQLFFQQKTDRIYYDTESILALSSYGIYNIDDIKSENVDNTLEHLLNGFDDYERLKVCLYTPAGIYKIEFDSARDVFRLYTGDLSLAHSLKLFKEKHGDADEVISLEYDCAGRVFFHDFDASECKEVAHTTQIKLDEDAK